MALNLFGGGKVDHPMADPKRARELVSELPAGDAVKAVAEITEWLESINETAGFKLDRRFENADLLDGAAKTHQRKLLQDYLAIPRQQRFQENRLWTGMYGLWKGIGDAYIRCVDEHEAGASGAGAIRKNLPVIVARALRALIQQLKWVLLRYAAMESRIWTDLARLYQLAERKGFADAPIAIYPGAHESGTVKQEFLKGLVLAASSPDSLAPLRLEVAERVTAHFSGAFRLSDNPEGCTHCFDLGAPRTPVRLLKGAAQTATLRFFGATGALAGLEQLTRHINERGVVPGDVNLGGNYDKDVVLGVLRHLALQWSESPPVRSAQRRQTAGGIMVVPGFAEILGVLEATGTGDALDFSEAAPEQFTDNWVVVNASDASYGAIVPSKKSEWLKVGTLVGVKSEVSRHWGVGVVRRISTDSHQQRQVGIQLLTKVAIPVRLARSGATVPASVEREAQSAILLSGKPDDQGEVGVVLREGVFNGRESLDMTMRDQSFLLMPALMVEDGDGFDWARFKMAQRTD